MFGNQQLQLAHARRQAFSRLVIAVIDWHVKIGEVHVRHLAARRFEQQHDGVGDPARVSIGVLPAKTRTFGVGMQ